jgi:hypothetical protein
MHWLHQVLTAAPDKTTQHVHQAAQRQICRKDLITHFTPKQNASFFDKACLIQVEKAGSN